MMTFSRVLDAVGAFAETANDARRRHFWFGWLCARIGAAAETELPTSALQEALHGRDPAQIADAVSSSLSVLSSWLDGIERSRGSSLVITYDGLDRIGTSPTSREQLTARVGSRHRVERRETDARIPATRPYSRVLPGVSFVSPGQGILVPDKNL